jgi:hypothetical protein
MSHMFSTEMSWYHLDTITKTPVSRKKITDKVHEIVSPIFSDNTGIILLRTSGLVRASRTLSVMFFLDTGVFLMVSRWYQDISVLNICDISVLGTGHLGTRYWKFRYWIIKIICLNLNCLFDVHLTKDVYKIRPWFN